MQRTLIKDVYMKLGETITIQGWVHTLRNQGGIKFLLVRDQSNIIQTVILKNSKAPFQIANELTNESVVSITGTVKEEKQAPNGIEILVESIEVLSKADPDLPIPIIVEKGSENTEQPKRWDWRWLDLRNKPTLFRVWTELERAFRAHYESQDYIQIYTPSFMSMASEGGAEVFEVKYFDRKAYLAQSPQFYKQMAMASGLEKVFIMGPVFRAEPSYTTRHMTEFTGWDFEISFINSHYDIMKEEEILLVNGFQRLKDKIDDAIDVPTIPFPKISMRDAKEKLRVCGITSNRVDDLNPEEERELSRIIKDETGHEFVFVTEFPATVRPFYHMRLEQDPTLTKSFDLLYRGIEITTGAQREHRYDVLKQQASDKSIEIDTIETYLNFFKFGCPPHGGVGIGPGRIVMALLNLPNVKEATFLPRDVRRLTP